MTHRAALVLSTIVSLAAASPLSAAAPIFPTPLHLTREVSDPISGRTVVIDEYAYGNRLVAVRDHVTAIADYEKGELIEIDRGAGTWSVTRFETIAKAARLQGAPEAATASSQPSARRELKALGAKATKSGRAADFFRAEGESQSVEVALDRNVRVSREALEVLLGIAYPGTRGEHHDLVIDAARGANDAPGRRISAAGSPAGEYALPLEQTLEVDAGGAGRVEFRSSVIRVGSETPPADLLAIPPGARLVESRTAGVLRELELQP